MDAWYTGYATSHYANTVLEYMPSQTSSQSYNYLGHIVDTSAVTGYPWSSSSVIQAEVCSIITSSTYSSPTILSQHADGTLYVPVHVDTARYSYLLYRVRG